MGKVIVNMDIRGKIKSYVRVEGYYIQEEPDSFTGGKTMADVYYHFEAVIRLKENDSFETLVERAYKADWLDGSPIYKGIEHVATGSVEITPASQEDYKDYNDENLELI